MLVICGELDCVCDKPGDEKYVVGGLEGSMGLFDSLVNRECDDQKNQVLYDCFRRRMSTAEARCRGNLTDEGQI